jgi:hypothetical protein
MSQASDKPFDLSKRVKYAETREVIAVLELNADRSK